MFSLSSVLVLRCCVGVLHSYSPLSVSTVLMISRVPNSVSLNLRLLPIETIHKSNHFNQNVQQQEFVPMDFYSVQIPMAGFHVTSSFSEIKNSSEVLVLQM